MTEQKPKFKLEANRPEIVTLNSDEPFWSGTNTYGKTSYGYNVSVNDKEMTWFASEAAERILRAGGVKSGVEFTIELKSGNTSEGKPFQIYLINGSSLRDCEGGDIPSIQQSVAPVEVKSSLESRVDALEKAMEVIVDNVSFLYNKTEPPKAVVAGPPKAIAEEPLPF